MTAPERERTLAEVCELYFPGVSACALRWMIKRRGYAHSRWGREYRLTDSQVAAIQADMTTPATPGASAVRRSARAPGGSRSRSARQVPGAASATGDADITRRPGRRQTPTPPDAKRALAERLSAPLSAEATEITS